MQFPEARACGRTYRKGSHNVQQLTIMEPMVYEFPSAKTMGTAGGVAADARTAQTNTARTATTMRLAEVIIVYTLPLIYSRILTSTEVCRPKAARLIRV